MAIDVSEYPNKIKTNLWGNKSYSKFYYNFKQGKRYRGIIDLSDKVAWGKRDRVDYASAELVKIKIKKRDGGLHDGITLDVFLMKHYETIEATNWKRTRLSHYDRYIKQFVGHKAIAKVLEWDIKESIKYQQGVGLAPRTVKQTIEVLSPVFKSAIANKLMLHNPMDGIKVKIPSTKKIVTDASEVLVEIYNAIMEEFGDEPFYKCIYLLAMQGRRKGEILQLKCEDVSFKRDYYVIRNSKNDEEMKIYLPPYIKGLMQQFVMDDVAYVFYNPSTKSYVKDIRKTTDRLKKRLGWNFTLHYLRNIVVSTMAENGIEAIHLSGALGHTSAKTIDKYLTLNYLKGSELASGVIDGVLLPRKKDSPLQELP